MQKNTNCPHCGENLIDNICRELSHTEYCTLNIYNGGIEVVQSEVNECDRDFFGFPDYDEGPYKCMSCDKDINDFVHDELLA